MTLRDQDLVFTIRDRTGTEYSANERSHGEGTRVVRNVSRNHYEPLRSAFGSFVAETTLISNCHLMCEGVSDRILLAGTSTRLRRLKTSSLEHLDLNTLTLVPAGSAPHVP
ncbi:hypothetical protein AB0G76_31545 [Streptomyces asoensis]|uniref:hypothetical protein n=1 Tax=Streptomyces asoensis TaxID=249586 RepID=UPI00340EB243